MSKKYNNFMQKFLMCMGIVMLYITILAFSIAYVPFAWWYFNNTFKNNSQTD